ncbi:MAG: hypothetical protein K2R98_08615, partial [Gemmataceae bacterium]|nr:hypothetical protein [Gemmataceae bacterium]
EDVQTLYGFTVSYSGTVGDAEYVPAAEMEHVKIGVDRAVKRGITDFCFDTYDSLKTASRAIQNMNEAVAIQAAIAFIRQHDTALAGQVQSFQDGLADYDRPNPFTGAKENVQRIGPGTVWDVPKGMTYVPPPFAQGIPYFAQVVQLVLRNVGAKWNAPEWLMSGDASNNNYASSITAESPFVKRCKTFQAFYGGVNVGTIWRAVKWYCEKRGGIKAGDQLFDYATIRRIVAIQAVPPTIEVRNTLQQAQENQIYTTIGVKSPQTVQQELSLDPEEQQANFDEFRERTGGQGGTLDLPADDPGAAAP